MTGSEKILREEISEPLTSHSLGLNDRWKISTAATQIQREDRTLSEQTSLTHASHWGPREVVKRDGDEDKSWQQINTFLVIISKIKTELHGLDMQRYKHI